MFFTSYYVLFSTGWSDLSLDNDFKKSLCWCGGGFAEDNFCAHMQRYLCMFVACNNTIMHSIDHWLH